MDRYKKLRPMVLLMDVLLMIAFFMSRFVVQWMFESFPKCVFYENGFLCPSCGGTRCARSILSGDFLAAFMYNPVIFLFALYLGFLVVLLNLRYVLKFEKTGEILGLSTSYKVIIGFGIAFAVFGILRNFI